MEYEVFSSKYFGIAPKPVNEKFTKLDMYMQKGYGYEFNGETIKALENWKIVFADLKKYMEEYNFNDLKSFDQIFNGNQFVSNWVQDYDEALREAILDSSKEDKQRYGKQKIELLTYLISLDEASELTEINYRRDLAETYYLIGKPEIGEQHFLKLIENYPDHVWGYVGYSDEYWLEYSKNKDYEKAHKILMDAYDRLTIEESDVIVERLAGLIIDMKKKELKEYLENNNADDLPNDITAIKAIDKLRIKSDKIPFPYLSFIEDNKEEALPIILKEMKAYIEKPDFYAQNNGLLSIYIPFILGQWEIKQSSKDIIDLVACSEESIDIRIGYSITEEYPYVIYKCFDGDLKYLKNAINKEGISSFSKLAYLRVLSTYYIEDLKDVEGLKTYLEKLLIEQPKLATWIASLALRHSREELLSVGKSAVNSKFYDQQYSGNWSEYKKLFDEGSFDETDKYLKPFNVIDELKKWTQQSDEKPVVPEYSVLRQQFLDAREAKIKKTVKKPKKKDYQETVIKPGKIGRNEPCPCGSGKKYKKCCGR